MGGYFEERSTLSYRLSENEKMDVAVVSMEDDALCWYTFESRRNPIRSLAEMKARVLAKYRPTNVGSLHEQWLATARPPPRKTINDTS